MAHVSTAMQLHAAADQRRLGAPPQQMDPAAWARRLAISVGFAEQWRLINSATFFVRQIAERTLLQAATAGGGGPRAKPAFLEAVAELKEVWDAAYDLGRSERGPQAGAHFRNLIQLIIKVTSFVESLFVRSSFEPLDPQGLPSTPLGGVSWITEGHVAARRQPGG